MFNKIFKSITTTLAIIFLFQAITNYSLIPTKFVLDFFGIGNGVFEIIIAILYGAIFIVVIGIVLSFFNKINVVKGVTKNTITLNLIVRMFMAFVIFFPTWITFILLGNLGILGEAVKIGLEHGKPLDDFDQVIFLNLYLFWFFLINTFIKPQIDPKWGLTKEEKDGIV